jgi:hypothetical protein
VRYPTQADLDALVAAVGCDDPTHAHVLAAYLAVAAVKRRRGEVRELAADTRRDHRSELLAAALDPRFGVACSEAGRLAISFALGQLERSAV